MVFKTTINCSNCVRLVSGVLNASVGEGKWSVDTENPDKLLTISNIDLSSEMIQLTIQGAGFEAELVSLTS